MTSPVDDWYTDDEESAGKFERDHNVYPEDPPDPADYM